MPCGADTAADRTTGRRDSDRRSLCAGPRAADHGTKEQLHQIIDGDAASLEERVVRALEAGPLECVVARFTYWYTGRPPVYEALVLRPPMSDCKT
jgi:hypothetical protein